VGQSEAPARPPGGSSPTWPPRCSRRGSARCTVRVLSDVRRDSATDGGPARVGLGIGDGQESDTYCRELRADSSRPGGRFVGVEPATRGIGRGQSSCNRGVTREPWWRRRQERRSRQEAARRQLIEENGDKVEARDPDALESARDWYDTTGRLCGPGLAVARLRPLPGERHVVGRPIQGHRRPDRRLAGWATSRRLVV
jgi:hypothetical protein